jgi:hypothetical protein
MSATATKSQEKPHTSTIASPQLSSSPQSPPGAAPVRAYWGDRWCLIFWLSCAGLLLALHIGQHVVYLLR